MFEENGGCHDKTFLPITNIYGAARSEIEGAFELGETKINHTVTTVS